MPVSAVLVRSLRIISSDAAPIGLAHRIVGPMIHVVVPSPFSKKRTQPRKTPDLSAR